MEKIYTRITDDTGCALTDARLVLESDLTTATEVVRDLDVENTQEHKKLWKSLNNHVTQLTKKIVAEKKRRETTLTAIQQQMITKGKFYQAMQNQQRHNESVMKAYNELQDALIKQMNRRFWICVACTALVGIALALLIYYT